MLQRQRGQAFILVLILLAVGALLITPALNLSFTGLRSRMAERADLMEYYAADGAQEYSLWLLTDPGFVADLIDSGESDPDLYIVLNGVQAEYTITWQASLGAPSDAPLTDDRYKITVQVTPDGDPDYLPPDTYTVFNYYITLQYMYPDVETEPLTQLQVILPPWFTYVDFSVEGVAHLEPDISSKLRKGFILDWYFDPAISFNYFETRSLSFQATATPAEKAYHTEAYVWTATVPQPRGLTGPTAPIIVGNPLERGFPRLTMTKTVDPVVIPPGVPTRLTYTIYLENLSTVEVVGIQWIRDTLPVGFSYLPIDPGEVSGTVFTRFLQSNPEHIVPFDPQKWTLVEVGDGIYRHDLEWSFTPIDDLYVGPGETLTLSFQAIGTVDSSGTYTNEVWIKAPGADVGEEYSWPTGGVIVPQFDIESSSGGTTLKVVTVVVSGGGHKIKSWQVE